MPTPRRSLWDHYLEAVQLLARAEVNIGCLLEQADGELPTLQLHNKMQEDISTFLKKKAPSFDA